MSLKFFARSPSKPKDDAQDEESAASEEQAAYERRRNQVRRAQRNHRERKANYIKALEQEVVTLRKQNQHNIYQLENEISLAHSILTNHGLTVPPRQSNLLGNAAAEDAPDCYIVTKSDGLKTPLRLQMPESTSNTSQKRTMSQAHLDKASFSSPFSSGTDNEQGRRKRPRQQVSSSGVANPSVHDEYSPGGVDKIYGIDFVLTLEYPCMAHPDVTRDQFGTHSHMATHNLLQYAPPSVAGPNAWEVPGANIERLLELSTGFNLEGEITPVQAWYQLKQHRGYDNLNAGQVQRLKSFLLKEVKCYGFGSVIDEQIWLVAIDEVMNRR